MVFTLDFLTPECQNEFVEIFGSSETAIDFYIHSYIEFKSQGGRFTPEHIKTIKIAKKVISDMRNNIYYIRFIYFPPKSYGKEVLSVHFEFEEVDPEYWEDENGVLHSSFEYVLKTVREELPDHEVSRNCGGIDVRLI